MNDDDKYRDRRTAGVLISMFLRKTGLGAKIGGGIVGTALVAGAAIYGVPIVLDDEEEPQWTPTPIIEPVNETSTPAIIKETKEPEWTPTPRPKDSSSKDSPSETVKSTAEVITPASSPEAVSTSEPSPTATPEPSEEQVAQATPLPTAEADTFTVECRDGDGGTEDALPDYIKCGDMVFHTYEAMVEGYPWVPRHQDTFPVLDVVGALGLESFEKYETLWIERIDRVSNFYHVFETDNAPSYDTYRVPTPDGWARVRDMAPDGVNYPDFLQLVGGSWYDVETAHIAPLESIEAAIEKIAGKVEGAE